MPWPKATTPAPTSWCCPELATTGYPPRDLLTTTGFVDPNLAVRERVAALTTDELGSSVGLRWSATGRRRQAAATTPPSLCRRRPGRRRATARRCCRPTTSSTRAATSSPAPARADRASRASRLGVTVCEDIWNDHELLAQPPLPPRPGRRPGAPGADLFSTSRPVRSRRQGRAPPRHDPAARGAPRVPLRLRQPGGRQRRADLRRPLDRLRPDAAR